MKKVFLIGLMFVGVQAFGQMNPNTSVPNPTIVNNPKLPDGVETGLSITYTKDDKLLFVTEKTLTLTDIDNIKVYVNWYYNKYNAWSPTVTRKDKKWTILFELR
jgi:hypothetical protein